MRYRDAGVPGDMGQFFEGDGEVCTCAACSRSRSKRLPWLTRLRAEYCRLRFNAGTR